MRPKRHGDREPDLPRVPQRSRTPPCRRRPVTSRVVPPHPRPTPASSGSTATPRVVPFGPCSSTTAPTGFLYYLDTTNNRRLNLGPFVPGGRATLTSATPVTATDVTAAMSVYYTPHEHDRVPIYDGENFVETVFSELTLGLDSNSGHTGYQQSGKNFDLFVVNDAGTIRLGTGSAWSSDTSRGTGPGTTELRAPERHPDQQEFDDPPFRLGRRQHRLRRREPGHLRRYAARIRRRADRGLTGQALRREPLQPRGSGTAEQLLHHPRHDQRNIRRTELRDSR